MRRTLLGLAAATLALTALPALADEEPSVLAACDAVAGAERLTLAGVKGRMPAPLTPSPSLAAVPLPRTTPDTTRTFVLDLAGQPVGTTATVSSLLTWGQAVNDFDLRITSGGSGAASQEVNPATGAAREQAGLSGLGHCASLTVAVQNYLAGPDSLVLETTAAVEEAEQG